MSASHTPGPWIVVRDRVSKRGARRRVFRESEENGRYAYEIAVIRSDPKPAAVSEADARLIAAAPELLQALEALLSQVKHGQVARFTVERAAEAIAKARGQS